MKNWINTIRMRIGAPIISQRDEQIESLQKTIVAQRQRLEWADYERKGLIYDADKQERRIQTLLDENALLGFQVGLLATTCHTLMDNPDSLNYEAIHEMLAKKAGAVSQN